MQRDITVIAHETACEFATGIAEADESNLDSDYSRIFIR
jgi:hypothetical protein